MTEYNPDQKFIESWLPIDEQHMPGALQRAIDYAQKYYLMEYLHLQVLSLGMQCTKVYRHRTTITTKQNNEYRVTLGRDGLHTGYTPLRTFADIKTWVYLNCEDIQSTDVWRAVSLLHGEYGLEFKMKNMGDMWGTIVLTDLKDSHEKPYRLTVRDYTKTAILSNSHGYIEITREENESIREIVDRALDYIEEVEM